MLRELRRSAGLYANPWTHYPRLIVSIDWLKRERPLRMLPHLVEPLVDHFRWLLVPEIQVMRPAP